METLARNRLKTRLELVLNNTKVIFFKAEFLYIFFLHLAVYVSKKGTRKIIPINFDAK